MSANTNTTTNTSATTGVNKTFYDKKLLTTAETKLVHAQFGQKRSIPKNNGKTIEFRRYNLFSPDVETLKLVEGVTASGQPFGQTTITETIEQYGAYVSISDLLDLTAYDPLMSDSVGLLGEQLGVTVDWITRNAMLAGASVQYGGGALSKKAIAPTGIMSLNEIRKAVAALKKAKARPFNQGGRDHFVCIVDPDVEYDLQADSDWKDVSKYSNAEQLYRGELGMLYGVRFVTSTEGKVDKQAVVNAVSANTTSSAEFVLKNDPTAAEIAYLSTGGNKIMIGSTEYTLAATDSFAAATNTVKLSAAASLAANAIVYSEDAGAPDASTKKSPAIHHSMIFGSDAFGVIDVSGSGAIQSIIKPVGSGDDPLNQRATVGAKVAGYAAKVLNSVWIIDIMTTATLTN